MSFLKGIFRVFFVLSLIGTLALISYASGHKHSFSVLYTVKPTCTEKGYSVFSCNCGESYKGSVVNALGHKFSKDVIYYKKATCLQKGESGRYCKKCYAKSDIIYHDKTPHTPEYVTVKATTKKNGEIRKECKICKKLYSRKVIYSVSSVKLNGKTFTYNGKINTPTVTVKDSKGKKLALNKDYTVKYQSGRKNVGKYSVSISFKGDYKGTKTLYFRIIPAAVKNLKAIPSLTSVYLEWDKSKGVEGYEIYLDGKKLQLIRATDILSVTVNKINGKKLENGKNYIFVVKGYKKVGDEKIYSSSKKIKVTTKPKKAYISKISASSGKVTVKITKQSCHGYQILLSTNKSFSNAKKVNLNSNNSTSYTFRNLVRGKKYYIKVRAYVNTVGEKFYGYYSEIKSFKA